MSGSGRGPRQGLTDLFTRVDELIKSQLSEVKSIRDEVDRIGDRLDSIAIGLSNLTGVDVEKGRVVQIELSTDVSSNTPTDNPDTTNRTVPFSGEITKIVVGWPSGADNRAGIQLSIDNVDNTDEEKLYPFNPEDDFIGLDDKTISHDSRFEVDSGDVLKGKFVNNDDTNSHFLNLIVTIEEDT